ncbi:MAG: hypothetical protein ACFE7R_05680 [Candidatus Hodarchaeota archaeon]
MSVEIPERSEMIRSTVLTVVLTVVLMILGLAFWAWSGEEVIDSSPVGALYEANPFLAPIFEVFIMFGVFVFLTVTVVNIRLYITQIRAGWVEVIFLLIVMSVITYLMFETSVAIVTVILSLGFIVYLYLLQD